MKGLGTHSQISTTLLKLVADESIERLASGVDLLPGKSATLGVETLLDRAHQRQAKAHFQMALLKKRTVQITVTARYVSALAKQHGVDYKPTFSDHWASAATSLTGDEVLPDSTDDLLVALRRDGILSLAEMLRLAMNHHRALKRNA